MGIENQLHARGRPRDGSHLITPHGDRKTYDAVGNDSSLITPHGDRKRYVGVRPYQLTHYPSWGSKTGRQACARGPGRSRCSLPLMGIENARPARHEAWRDHLDLITPHGDRKHGERPHRATADVQALITPHGDRKPWAAGRALQVPTLRLITPHGDRKLDLGMDHRAELRLITPHGDRKPLTRHVRIIDFDKLSLPLMGIENLDPPYPIVPNPRGKLITPHGDRKRLGPGGAAR